MKMLNPITYITLSLFVLIKLCICTPSFDEIYQVALENADELTQIRRKIHQYPELMLQEYETSKKIQDFLTEYEISYTKGWSKSRIDENLGGTGVVADIGTGHGPCIALRADMDALPIMEKIDWEFKSTRDGFMHACGHDSHTTMLMGAAKLLKMYENDLQGTVRIIFQPGEEGASGAKLMLDEGVFTHYPPVERSFGFHVDPKHPTGTIISRPGPIWGAVDGFNLKIIGKGGHAARHHQTIDPVTAGMSIVQSLYDIPSRELDFSPEYAGVISVTIFKTTSTATNIIPDEVTIGGTIRALTRENALYIRNRVYEVAQKISHAHKCTLEIIPKINQEFYPYPAVYNDPELYQKYKNIVSEGAIDKQITYTEPEMIAEDFAFMAEVVPSVFSFLGIGSGDEIEGHFATNASLHNSKFFLDERVLPRGAALHTHIAIQNLKEMSSSSKTDDCDEL